MKEKDNDIKVGDRVSFFCYDLENGYYAIGEVLAIKKRWIFSAYLVGTMLSLDGVERQYRYCKSKSCLFKM